MSGKQFKHAENDHGVISGDQSNDFEGGDEEDMDEVAEETKRSNLDDVFRRFSREKIAIRVHDVLIKGNAKTKDSLIEAEVEILKKATTIQELIQAAGLVTTRLQLLGIFDSVKIVLDSGPSELPGTANVIIDIVEAKSPLTGDIGIFTKPEARSWSLEGSLKWKNLFGYGDIWDESLAYGWDQTSEISSGVELPRFKNLVTPLSARVSLFSQDWIKYSSYKERLLALSLGLFSSKHHTLAYTLAWRTLKDPSHMSSRSVRRQLGHGLLSSLKYTFTVDRRDSPLRPTRGYAFVSISQIGGLVPDHRSVRFIRQELGVRCAIPFGFLQSALNIGISGGVIFPWGSGYRNMPSPLPDRFFLGGNSSPVSAICAPTTLLGFGCRGLGPSEPRRQPRGQSINCSSDESAPRDYLGGDLSVTAFADLSFDLPVKLLREAGIHAHVFANAGSLSKLTENEYRKLSLRNFLDSFRTSAGAGIVVPTKLFRMEVNYCYILKQLEYDRGKTGFQFCFSSPL